ncbi:hypothetical protein SAMN05216332_10858 [Nitrosospira briensis]|nr:hypothetical protein SAMN05216332_10858 [Nitrosospira briensis]
MHGCSQGRVTVQNREAKSSRIWTGAQPCKAPFCELANERSNEVFYSRILGLCQRYRSVIVTMITMRVMKMTVNQIVDMFAMRHHLVPAFRAVSMLLLMAVALVPRRAFVWIALRYIQ